MALRFLLVSLVAGLGLNPPTLPEVTTWVNSGRAWVQSRLDDFNGARLIAAREQADAEFDDVVADMADNFTVDLALMNQPRSSAQVAFEPIDVPDQLDAGYVFFLNRGTSEDVRSLSLTTEPYEFVGPYGEVAELVGPTADTTNTAVAMKSPTTSPIPTSRLASAVKLTRQAALAWMTLLREVDQTQVRY